jgi:REP element-mobilizing transposase RayT
MRKRRKVKGQRLLAFPSGWGGRRKGAGRKPKGERAGVPHQKRGELAARFPVHVTARVRAGLPSLRGQLEQVVLLGAFRAGCERFGFRLVHSAVLGNHMHYVVEAGGRRSLTAGLRGLHVRVARGLNRLWGRRGNVFPDRFHRRILKSPREVRAGLAYVLHNARKHGVRQRAGEPDRCSSGRWFDGWRDPPPTLEREQSMSARGRPVARARTWLLSLGWRRLGLLQLRA